MNKNNSLLIFSVFFGLYLGAGNLFSQTQKTLLGINKLYDNGSSYQGGNLFLLPLNSNSITANVRLNSNYTLGIQSNLIKTSNGKIYGITKYGNSANSSGFIFEFNPNSNVITQKTHINPNFDLYEGSSPDGSLTQATNGKLYGMTEQGGANGLGTLFEYDMATDVLTKKVDFTGYSVGSQPRGSLIKANNGKLYGLTSAGGVSNYGTIFEYDIALDTLIKLYDFDHINGRAPFGTLIQATNNKLYGTTIRGGAGDVGVLFEFDILTNTYSKKYSFTQLSGKSPLGNLIETPNGKLFGVTNLGGFNDQGVIYEYDFLTNLFTKKIDFDAQNLGSKPYGSLLLASDGKMYGTTSEGGPNYVGIIYKYDYISNSISKILDFDSYVNGGNPYCSLLEIDAPLDVSINEFNSENYNSIFSVYPNPSLGKFIIESHKKQVITINNSIGETVKVIEFKEKESESIDDLQSGIYLLYSSIESRPQKLILNK